MNYEDSPENADFRREVRDWLQQHAPRFNRSAAVSQAEEIAAARAWQSCKAEGGYAALTWPKSLGGRGASSYEQLIFVEEESRFPLPFDLAHGGVDVVIPALLKFAAARQYQALLNPTRSGMVIWSILLSEPSAGSDLSSVRLKATRTGDQWVLNGQKTWCSWARASDWALTLARTDPKAARHKGLSCFIVDMRSAGLTVRPIRFFQGDTHGFDDVFFSDVAVPEGQLIGREGEGLKILLSMLAVDRFAVSAQRELLGANVDTMFDLARQIQGAQGSRIQDADVRDRLADYYVDVLGVQNLRARHLTQLSHGSEPGPETAVGKVILANRLQEMAAFAMDLLGPAGVVKNAAFQPQLALMHSGLFMGAGLRIGAGTDEIIRNTIAERLLELPPDIRPDKDVPFDQS